MPSQITHLAIAKRYLAKHPQTIKDVQHFLDGNILPDLLEDKAVSHSGVRKEFTNLLKRCQEKVNPEKFRAEHDLSDDLIKGWYLHLFVDYQYYNVFLHDYIAQSNMRQSSLDLFEVTKRDDQYLMEKYQVAYHDSNFVNELVAINKKWPIDHHQMFGYDYQYTFPYELSQLDAFIEAMSDTLL